MSASRKEDVNDVLNDVIININRITDHVRAQGENEAASRFTYDMTNTLKNLYNVIASWDIEKCLMAPPEDDQAAVTNCDSTTQARAAAKSISAPSPGATWAAIAATEPVTDQDGIVRFCAGDNAQSRLEQHDAGIPTTSRDYHDNRVIWIRPWTPDRPLKEVTQKMNLLGSIYSVAYAPEAESVCIIFQRATSAAGFMKRCADHLERNGISPFGPEHDVAPGLPYPMNKDLARMEMPITERRRLTFARAGLFNKEGVTQQRFRQDIEVIVGPSNIELFWLFNTGNATVVFSAVPLARLVRNTFLEYGRQRNSRYCGIMVSYSHDPCERDMHLVSQIPGHPGFISGGSNPGQSSTRPRGFTIGASGTGGPYMNHGPFPGASHKRRITGANEYKANMSEDGWQTVKKRR